LWYLPLHSAQPEDFAEPGEGIAFAAFQDFSWNTILTGSELFQMQATSGLLSAPL